MKQITGAELFVKALKEENVTTQFLAIDHKKQMITSGGLGTMGYGFPAAMGPRASVLRVLKI